VHMYVLHDIIVKISSSYGKTSHRPSFAPNWIR
jgi:hypothetical protein